MRRVVLSFAAALAAVYLAACGSNQAAADMANAALGGSASVDMGEDGEVRIDTGDGSMEIGTGEFPEGWPADLAVISGFTLVAASNTPEGLSAQMIADGDQTLAVDAYVKDLQANKGWAVDPSIPLGTPNMWALTKEGKVATIFAAASGGQTVVIFSITDR
ncbi:MAG: hypothetical protein ACO3X2_05215 [Candidatus Nanopelagicales bacterium]